MGDGRFEGQIAQTNWPTYDESKCKDAQIEMVVQISGKLRGRFVADANIDKEAAIAAAKAVEGIAAQIEGKTIVKEIYVPGKLVNLVVR